jgi:ParB family transcriptional regulator, chromosome partitioning protein
MLATGRRSRESLSAARRGESDMASAVQKIKLSPSRDIPFNKLVLSQSYPVVRIAKLAAA